jgi:hypothetical protein
MPTKNKATLIQEAEALGLSVSSDLTNAEISAAIAGAPSHESSESPTPAAAPVPVLAGDELKKGTHINAFFQDVEDAKQKVAVAQGNLDEAIGRLESHPDYVAPEPTE